MHGFPIRRASGATLALSLALVACRRTDKAPTSDSATAAAPRAQSLASSARGARGYPGALTKSIDAYSGDELYELTRGLRYAGSHERQRKCRKAAGCDGPSAAKQTLVQVSAVATQDSISAANVPPFGVVYVRAINRGDAEEARYGMRSGSTLRYYAIVRRDSSGALGWRLEELETAVPRRHVQVAAGRMHSCGHAWSAGARADFRSCATPERQDTVVTLALSLPAINDPMWTMCDSGCCEFAP